MVYIFIAAITNHCKFSGSKPHKSYSPGDLLPEIGLHSRHQQGCIPSGGDEKIRFLVFSDFKRLPTFLGSWPHFFQQSQQSHQSNLCFISPSLTPLPPCFIYKDPNDYIGPTQVTWDDLPSQCQLVSKLNSSCNLNSYSLPCNVIYSQFLDQDVDIWEEREPYSGCHTQS